MSLFDRFKKHSKSSDPTQLQPIGVVLKNDMQHFYDNPGKESVDKICETLIAALAQKDYTISVPIDIHSIKDNGFSYLMLNHEPLGEKYKAYTGLSGFGLDHNAPMAETSVLVFFERIARDSCSGLVLDHNCGHSMNVVLGREDVFKVLFGVRYLQKATKKTNSNEFDKDFLFAEKGLIYRNIDAAIENHIKEKSGEAHQVLCEHLIYAVMYNLSYRMAMNKSVYHVYQHEQVGPVYMMFSNMESAILHDKFRSSFAKTRTIFERVIADDVNGLVIDGGIYLSKENIKHILKYGYEQIELQPMETRKFMLEEM